MTRRGGYLAALAGDSAPARGAVLRPPRRLYGAEPPPLEAGGASVPGPPARPPVNEPSRPPSPEPERPSAPGPLELHRTGAEPGRDWNAPATTELPMPASTRARAAGAPLGPAAAPDSAASEPDRPAGRKQPVSDSEQAFVSTPEPARTRMRTLGPVAGRPAEAEAELAALPRSPSGDGWHTPATARPDDRSGASEPPPDPGHPFDPPPARAARPVASTRGPAEAFVSIAPSAEQQTRPAPAVTSPPATPSAPGQRHASALEPAARAHAGPGAAAHAREPGQSGRPVRVHIGNIDVTIAAPPDPTPAAPPPARRAPAAAGSERAPLSRGTGRWFGLAQR